MWRQWNFIRFLFQMANPLVEATLQLYKSSLSSFLPTPAKCHYMFNLRDFARVVRGVRLLPSSHLRDPNKLIRSIIKRENREIISLKFIYYYVQALVPRGVPGLLRQVNRHRRQAEVLRHCQEAQPSKQIFTFYYFIFN